MAGAELLGLGLVHERHALAGVKSSRFLVVAPLNSDDCGASALVSLAPLQDNPRSATQLNLCLTTQPVARCLTRGRLHARQIRLSERAARWSEALCLE